MTTALEPAFGGKDIVISRDIAGTLTPIGIISTKEKTRSYEYDDATVADPANPGATPDRRSFKKAKSWTMNFSGIAGTVGFRTLENDAEGETAVSYRFEIKKPLASGGGYWEGACWFENLQLTSQDNGVCKFSAQLRGEGALAWTAAAS